VDDAAATLYSRQDELQREADEVLIDLDLISLLSAVGEPVRVGSSAMGLMVRRDIDITVICTRLELNAVIEAGFSLANHPKVREIVFRNDTGHWNTDPNYPDGLYLGIRYRSAAGDTWNTDIWFVDQPERQPDLAHLRTIPPRLDDQTRTAILALKAAWVGRPEYGSGVSSADVYSAVLDGGVRTLEQFDGWLALRPVE
jgi:hypothetical protein